MTLIDLELTYHAPSWCSFSFVAAGEQESVESVETAADTRAHLFALGGS